MNPITSLVYYDGHWNENNVYEDFKMLGVLIPLDCSFTTLMNILSTELSTILSTENATIEYQIAETLPPLKIKSDSSIQFYLECKRNDKTLTKYPLIVSVTENNQTITCGALQKMSSTVASSSNNIENDISDTSTFSIDEPQGLPNFIQLADQITDLILEKERHESIPEHIGTETTIITHAISDGIREKQVYKNKEVLTTTIGLYAIKNNFQFKVHKSCKKEYQLKCLDSECTWSFRAARYGKTDMFQLRKFNRAHTCSLDIILGDHRQASSSMVGNVVKTKFTDPKTNYRPKDIAKDMLDRYGVSMSYQKAWRSKEKAVNYVHGSSQDSYRDIPRYLHILKHKNPGTVTDLQIDSLNRFKYLYMAMGQSILGWKHCIPVIVVDGTFLKAAFGGTLLTASTQDANRHIFPLAFAITDSENNDSWEWFFRKIKECYGEREELCIVSDRHESIENAIKNVFPNVTHGVCSYHLFCNIKTKFKTDAEATSIAFHAAAKAYNMEDFEKYMKDLDSLHEGIRPFLANEVKYEKWARIHSKSRRYAAMTSNIAESINAALKEMRELPVTTLLECLRNLIQKWSYNNKKEAEATFTELPKKQEEYLRKNFVKSLRMTVEPASTLIYSVHNGLTTNIVDIANKSCSCNKFDLDELPCEHAMAVIRKMNLQYKKYCSYYFTKQAMLNTYNASIHPLGDPKTWRVPPDVEEIEVLPPKGNRKSGRPRKKRFVSAREGSYQLKCGSTVIGTLLITITCDKEL
ncbi:uncharacterized protein LOC133823641 [Humulus lupulus]|uniref:uncharacterized protein LOC133823641 n=1 Tax=Humulus lupulus TaxID=3486 RepID=UPI002B4114AC|nr:uncharacterized protein LOC133823641 [Humulus lupulus]